uniref:Uncharacterized protein n=1 Tax=Sphaerodactylus townsendi TaxID=933632 RepID=A0ACB8FVJ0_9SAUR
MSGVIKSPGFPEKYPNGLECTYIIFAPKMSEIILEFESFELEPDSSPPGGMVCRYDRLEIWDGFAEASISPSQATSDKVDDATSVEEFNTGVVFPGFLIASDSTLGVVLVLNSDARFMCIAEVWRKKTNQPKYLKYIFKGISVKVFAP